MNVSQSFYLGYWFKNTLMSLATGALLGLLASRIIIIDSLPMNILIGALIAAILYQLTAYNKFWGKRRGELEFDFKVGLIEKKVKKLVLHHLGVLQYLKYVSDGLNNISTAQGDLCKQLIQNEHVKSSDENIYLIDMKMSFLEMKNGNMEQMMAMLRSALNKNPDDFIAHVRLAVCLEQMKDADSAMKHYRQALTDKSIDSDQLKDYINTQIKRVESKGPMNKPPTGGFRYTSW